LKQGRNLLRFMRGSEESGVGVGGMAGIEPVPEGVGVARLAASLSLGAGSAFEGFGASPAPLRGPEVAPIKWTQ